MKKNKVVKLALVTAFGMLVNPASAHFKLLEPASWIQEDERGNPQKLAPCGGTLADGGVRTGTVTAVRGGDALDVAITETVYHPGHYRVALARKINWLPQDAVATMKDTDSGPRSASFPIEAQPLPPVLVDGLWENYERRTGNLETTITMPNIDCKGCVLQVVQFMLEHPGVSEGGFTYHHCAIVDITPNEALPLDTRW